MRHRQVTLWRADRQSLFASAHIGASPPDRPGRRSSVTDAIRASTATRVSGTRRTAGCVFARRGPFHVDAHVRRTRLGRPLHPILAQDRGQDGAQRLDTARTGSERGARRSSGDHERGPPGRWISRYSTQWCTFVNYCGEESCRGGMRLPQPWAAAGGGCGDVRRVVPPALGVGDRGSLADHVGSESAARRLGGFPEHFEHARVDLQPAADTIFERRHGQ